MPKDAPKDQIKAEFARRLQARMMAKGWTQSELSRNASRHLPTSKTFGRDSISLYIRGKSLPRGFHLKALCDALGCTAEDLIPIGGRPSAGEGPQSPIFRSLEDGNVSLHVNQTVDMETALQVIQLLTKRNRGD